MRRALLTASVLGLLVLRCPPRAHARPDPAPAAAPDALRFTLTTPGPALIRWDEAAAWKALGLPATSPLQVSFGGEALARARPATSAAAAGSWLWRAPADAPGPWTLQVGSGGYFNDGAAADVKADVKIEDPAAPAISVERWEVRDALGYGSVESATPEVYDRPVPHFFLAKLPRGGETKVSVPLPAPGPVDEATVRVKVAVVGTHLGDAKVSATWGGTPIGTAFAPKVAGGATLTFTLPAKDAPAPGTSAALVLHDDTAVVPASADPNDTSDDVGTIWIASVVVEAAMKAHEGPRLVRDGDVRERLEEIDVTGRWVPHRTVTDARERASACDELILATAPLIAGARRLAEHRTRTGTKAIVLAIEDVWDAASGGQASSEALNRFLLNLPQRRSHLPFLLLVGDADRDRPTPDTIPTAYVRTVYNGATASDRALSTVGLDGESGALPTGRLPFHDPKELDAYVDRVIRTETKPPLDDSRRTLRFVTSEGRFGPAIDMLIENLFAQVLSKEVPAAYDVEVTFARAGSPWGWPAPEFHRKVVASLGEGSLFYSYVGHGWWNGFDSLRVEGRRYPILRNEDVPQVDVTGTPPAMFVVACTTALFDDPAITSVGERLLARPHGPLTYWGATRVCHPAWNSLVGRQLAVEVFRAPHRAIGTSIEAAVAACLGSAANDPLRAQIEIGARIMLKDSLVGLDRLKTEGAGMYALLGDPAIRLPFPKDDLHVAATKTVAAVEVKVYGDFPDGTEVAASAEVPRSVKLPYEPDPKLSPEENMRRRHARANDKALERKLAKAAGGVATFSFDLPEDRRPAVLIVKAHAVFADDVHQGATQLGE